MIPGAALAADEDWLNLYWDYDRHGVRRWYVRLSQRTREDGTKWRPKVRIRAVRGSEEFAKQYWAARNSDTPDAPPKPAGPAPMLRGTFGYAARRYLYDEDSPFKKLDQLTQDARKRVINKLIEKAGHKPTVLDPDDIRRGRDKRGHGAAKDFVTAIRKIYEHAIDKKLCSTDPTAGIKVKKKKTRGYYSWTLQDCLAYEAHWPVGTKQRTAYALGLYLATRASDAHRLGRRWVQAGQIHYTQFKNRNRDPVHMTQPIVPPLKEALDAWQGKGFTFLETEYGMPFTRKGFYGKFKKWCVAAGLPMCTFHGLRKATAARLAEHGYSTKQIQAVLGDRTMQQAEVYTQAADTVKMGSEALTGLYGERVDPPLIEGGSKSGKKA